MASWDGIFLGPDTKNQIYFYFPKDNKIRVYDFMGTYLVKEFNLQEISSIRTQCFTKDPVRELVVLWLFLGVS